MRKVHIHVIACTFIVHSLANDAWDENQLLPHGASFGRTTRYQIQSGFATGSSAGGSCRRKFSRCFRVEGREHVGIRLCTRVCGSSIMCFCAFLCIDVERVGRHLDGGSLSDLAEFVRLLGTWAALGPATFQPSCITSSPRCPPRRDPPRDIGASIALTVEDSILRSLSEKSIKVGVLAGVFHTSASIWAMSTELQPHFVPAICEISF
jgi:hypothetical protein